jgi:hypothetical protein
MQVTAKCLVDAGGEGFWARRARQKQTGRRGNVGGADTTFYRWKPRRGGAPAKPSETKTVSPTRLPGSALHHSRAGPLASFCCAAGSWVGAQAVDDDTSTPETPHRSSTNVVVPVSSLGNDETRPQRSRLRLWLIGAAETGSR